MVSGELVQERAPRTREERDDNEEVEDGKYEVCDGQPDPGELAAAHLYYSYQDDLRKTCIRKVKLVVKPEIASWILSIPASTRPPDCMFVESIIILRLRCHKIS